MTAATSAPASAPAPAKASHPRAVGAAPDGATDGARRAALMLHALSEHDRDWLLAALPAADRAALGALVAELQALGIPADCELLAEIVREPAPGAVAAASTERPTSPLDAIEAALPGLVAEVLRGEPAGLVAQVLRLRDFAWRDEVLRRLGATQRREIEHRLGALASSPAAPALRDRLVAAVLRRLEAAREAGDAGTARPAAPARRGVLRRLFRSGARP